MASTPFYPKPINTPQLELLTIINRHINDGTGTPRAIFNAAPLWAIRDGSEKFMKAICILVDRGCIMPMDDLRLDTYLTLTDFGAWIIGDNPVKPKAATRSLAAYIQAERGYNERTA